MKNIILLASLLSVSSMSFCSFLNLGRLRATISKALSRYTRFAPRAFATKPAQANPPQIEIDVQNPPSLMKAVYEQNYDLIKAALEKGVKLTELDKHGKNASGYSFHLLNQYEQYLVRNALYSKEAFAKRERMAKIVALFNENTARLVKAKS